MKNITYGNALDLEDENRLTGNNTEFYKANDIFSKRVINRGLISSYEDAENVYGILQNICKTLYGQLRTGILPDVYEEMNADDIKAGYFFDEKTTFVRVPTGAFYAQLDDEQASYYASSYEESNQYSRDFFIDNDRNAAIIVNRPNLELFERQLADHFNMDLHDQDTEVNVYCESYTDEHTSSLSDTSTENDIYNDIEKKYSRPQKIRYYANFSKTAYDYVKRTDENTVITSTVETTRIPIDSTEYYSDVFSLVKGVKNIYGNYLMKRDSEFSLEEIIPIYEGKNSDGEYVWNDGEYIIFFNPNTQNAPETATDNEYPISYSYSKRFGMMKASNYKKAFGDNDYTFIKLYKVNITFQDAVNEIRRCDIEELNRVSYLSKIDRTTLTIKNINLTNAINGLIVEKVEQTDNEGSINISNAHIKPEDDEKDNIAIGLRTLGYSKSDSGDQDPTLLSQRYKTNLGSNNLAIGTNAMRNTSSSNGKKPYSNIAVGTDTLVNVGVGARNIEIGVGNGDTKNTEGMINIGQNIKSIGSDVINFGEDNVVLGFDNGNNLAKIGSQNTIIGFENKSSESMKIVDNNYIFGKNKITSLGSNNIVVSNASDELTAKDSNIIIGEENNKGEKGSSNAIIGHNNSKELLGDNNYILGSSNNSTTGTEETSNNLITGYSNEVIGDSNFIAGYSNTNSGDKNVSIGRGNLTEEKSINNYVIGDNNTIFDDSENIIGNNNIIAYENNSLTIDSDKYNSYTGNVAHGSFNIVSGVKNDIFGKGNKIIQGTRTNASGDVSLVAQNNSVFGDNNIVYGSDNIVISNGKTVNYDNNIIIGTSEKYTVNYLSADNQLLLGPLGGTTYYENGTTIDETNLKKTSATFKIDGDSGEITSYFKTMKIVSNNISSTGNINVSSGRIHTDRYLSQNEKGSTMWVSSDDSHTLGVPLAGTKVVDDDVDKVDYIKDTVSTMKSLVGSLHTSNSATEAFDIISIREKNGKGNLYNTAATMGSVIYVNRSTGRMYSLTQNKSSGDWDTTYTTALNKSKSLIGLKDTVNNTAQSKADPREIIDSVGDQTIEGLMTFNGSIKIPQSSSTVKAEIFNGLHVKGDVIFDDKDDENTEMTFNVDAVFTDILTVKNSDTTLLYINPEEETTTLDGSSYYNSNDNITLYAKEGSTNIKYTESASIKSEDGTVYISLDTKKISSLASEAVHNTTSTNTITANGLTTTFGKDGYCYYASGDTYTTGTQKAQEFYAFSARAKKKNIKPTKHNAVEEINKIKIVDFNFKTDTDNSNPKVGFIADDTDEVFSSKTKDKMDLYNCVGMLLKAVQELSEENKELKEEISKLKK